MEDSLAGLDDASLIQQALRGDDRAYDQLVFRHQDKVFAFVLTKVSNKRAAKEIRDDTFSKAWEKLPKYRGKAQFSTWLKAIAKNLCHDYYRARGREKERTEVELDAPAKTDEGELVYPQIPSTKPSPADELILAERRQRVWDALNKLDEPTRTWMFLHWTKDLTYKEISKITSIPEGTIKPKCNEAKEALGNMPELRELFEGEP